MKKFQLIIPIVLVWCAIGETSWATTAYVTDTFEVTLRTGPSVQNKIVLLLSSGQTVEALETSDGWTRVRISRTGENAIEGWVLSRYLETRLPWKTQVGSLEKENTRLKERLAQVEKNWSGSAHAEQELAKKLEANTIALTTLRKEYNALKQGAAGYLKMKAAYEAARSSLETAQKNVQRLTKENETLKSSQRNRWLAMGALVLLCGLMIGVVVGRQEKKAQVSILLTPLSP